MKQPYMKPEMEICLFVLEERLANCPINPGQTKNGNPAGCTQDWSAGHTS